MNFLNAAALASALAIASHMCKAEVSVDESRELGATLTPFGSVKAGNADGSIPAWTGGMTKPPPGYVGKLAPGAYIDPFKDEKPILRIDGNNMASHADKLSAGARELLKRNPGYYLDIYPTHRTAAYPESVYEATKRNATKCKTLQGGLSLDPVCRGGIPFPIPKTGFEAMWNHLVAYQPPVELHDSRVQIVDTSGRSYIASEVDGYMETPFYLGDKRSDPEKYNFVYFNFKNPPRSRGQVVAYADYLDPLKQPRKAWFFDPGQRRMKLAPTFAYDTPAAPAAGTSFFDDAFLFTGAMDRFDFKLIGRKEMILPYNNYKLSMQCVGEAALKPRTLDPSCERWELHRVWVVEATLKAGMRHAYSKRVIYLDEDMPGAGMADNYDSAGNLHRALFTYPFQVYDASGPFAGMYSVFDFAKGNYSLNIILGTSGYYNFHPRIPGDKELTPEALAGGGND